MKVKRKQLIDEVCRRVGITRRNTKRESFDKRELLHVYSYINLLETVLDADPGDLTREDVQTGAANDAIALAKDGFEVTRAKEVARGR